MTIANSYKKLTLKDSFSRYSQGKVWEHRKKVEDILNRPLLSKNVVHHVDYDKSNNSNENLVVCPDQGYHKLLHMRTDSLNNSGNANYMKCSYCKKYDDPKNMYVRKNSLQAWHRECSNAYKAIKNPKTGPYKKQSRSLVWDEQERCVLHGSGDER